MTKVASAFPVIGGERHSNIMPTCTTSCKYISQMVNWAIKKSMNFWEKITCQQYLRSQYDSATPKRSMKISVQFSFTHTKQYQSLLDKLNGYMEICHVIPIYTQKIVSKQSMQLSIYIPYSTNTENVKNFKHFNN